MAFPAERLPRSTGPDRLGDPPPELAPHEVDWSRYNADHLQELESVLAQARDEKPLQTFLADHPHVLILGILGQKRQAWALDRPSFGGKYFPDFLVGMRDSLGPTWMLVELESPTTELLRKDGEPRRELNHAVQQIRDYRRWLRDNHDYFRRGSGCWGIEAGCTGTVVIGRREMRGDRLGAGRTRRRERRRRRSVLRRRRCMRTAGVCAGVGVVACNAAGARWWSVLSRTCMRRAVCVGCGCAVTRMSASAC